MKITSDDDPKGMGMYLALSQCGLEMVAPIILGVLIDHWLGTIPWFTVIFTVIGFGGGITHMVILSNKIQKREDEKNALRRLEKDRAKGIHGGEVRHLG